MASDKEFKLQELAYAAGVTPRTVRYYIGQGLLRSPGRLGPGTRYTREHLERLRLIKRLQEERLPLAEIREGLGDSGLPPAADVAPVPRPPLAVREPAESAAARTAPADLASSTQWQRILLAPDIELHVRQPVSMRTSRIVEELTAHVRQLTNGAGRR